MGISDSIVKGLKEGFDLIPLLEKFHAPDAVVHFFQQFSKQAVKDLAVALAFYKVLTPLRYMATVACTVPSIKFLVRRELIKPVPSRQRLKEIIQTKRGKFD